VTQLENPEVVEQEATVVEEHELEL